jgi:hypothetical protein
MIRSIVTAAIGLALATMTAMAQDMMRHIDLSSPDMVSAEMTREEVEAALAAAPSPRLRTLQERNYPASTSPGSICPAQFSERHGSTRQSSSAPD